MTLYGGLDFGVASPIAYSGNTVGGYSSDKVKASDDGTHMPEYPSKVDVGGGYSDGYAQPKKEQDTAPDNGGGGFYIPSFEDGESTPKWKEAEPQPQEQEKHLDVKKLLEGQTEGYRLYDDGEGGLTVDPNSKGGVYYGPGSVKSFAPKTKKQTATAALPEVSQIYNMEGDDYSFDTDAFAAAQMGTGNNKVANSIVGGGGGGASRDSSADNHNDAIFGGEKQKATPGKSLLPERILF
jgi:hypothetical protein